MTPSHLAGIGCILIAAGTLFGSVGHVLLATSKGKPLSDVPLLRYNGVAILACLIGLVLLMA